MMFEEGNCIESDDAIGVDLSSVDLNVGMKPTGERTYNILQHHSTVKSETFSDESITPMLCSKGEGR